MQSILEELYMGNIGFDTRYYSKGSSYAKAARRKFDSMEKLEAMLDDAGKELFDEYCDARGEIEGIVRYDTYMDAVKFGVQLMAEVLMDNCTSTEGQEG